MRKKSFDGYFLVICFLSLVFLICILSAKIIIPANAFETKSTLIVKDSKGKDTLLSALAWYCIHGAEALVEQSLAPHCGEPIHQGITSEALSFIDPKITNLYINTGHE